MKVFISWSGEISRQIAVVFQEWLTDVIPSVEPFVSVEDIEVGKRGIQRISQELQESSFGILCYTRENLHNDWMLYEAGALAKIADQSNVVPFLFNVEKDDLPAPIQEFQHIVFDKESIRKLVKDVNKACSERNEGRSEESLLRTFEGLYGGFEARLKELQDTESEVITVDTFSPEDCGRILAESLNAQYGRNSNVQRIMEDLHQYIRTTSHTPIAYDGINKWFCLKNRTVEGCAPVFMGTKRCIEDGLTLEEREKGAKKIRILNFAGTSFLANKEIATAYGEDWRKWFEDALMGGVAIDMILTAPDTAAADDAAKYKMYPTAGSDVPSEVIIEKNFRILSEIDERVNSLKNDNPDIKLIARKTEIALPYAVLETIFDDQSKNHIKIDLYSPLTNNDDKRPSFMIYKADHRELYDHFSQVISSVANERTATQIVVDTTQG